MRSMVEAAMPVFVRHARSDDRALVAALASSVCDRPTAARLVAFMPLAFARVMLNNSGVKFSGTFARRRAGAGPSAERPLADETVFAAAVEVARSGVEREEMLAIATRSAEFHAINRALRAGSSLADLECAPPILTWDEDGEPSGPPRRRWWQLWRPDG